MPDRIVRANILTSERVNQLGWPEEVFYRRLINAVDDFGRYDARPCILRSALFPLCLDKVREADISRWLATCQKAGLIVLYEVASKPYLELLNLGDRRRAKHSKYPEPPPSSAGTCRHVSADADIRTALSTDSDSDSDSETRSAAGSARGFDEFWQAWPDNERRVNRKGCLKHWISEGLEAKAPLIVQSVERWKASKAWTKNDGEYIPQPLTWLHQNRWEATPSVPAQRMAAAALREDR